jgi:Zn-dependent peptidase ImmA (M78 family)
MLKIESGWYNQDVKQFQFPAPICQLCKQGLMQTVIDYKSAFDERLSGAFEYTGNEDDLVKMFTAHLRCNNSSCNQHMVVAGSVNLMFCSEFEISKDMLEDYNYHGVDVKKVAAHLKVEVVDHPFEEDVSGVLSLRNDKATIGVNKNHHSNRKRFTIAHEIGHFALEHQRPGSVFVDKHGQHTAVIYRNSKSSTGEDEQEREANAFAAALLMPAPLVRAELENTRIELAGEDGDSVISKLSKLFEVSMDAMAYRLAGLRLLNN